MRLLIAEDSPTLAIVIERYAEELAAERKVVTKLEEARMEAEKWKPDVIWLDLNLDDAVDHETINSIPLFKSIASNAIIVVMSGIHDPNLEWKCMSAGADAFMFKGAPVTRLQVIQLLGFGALRAASRIKDVGYSATMLENISKALRSIPK